MGAGAFAARSVPRAMQVQATPWDDKRELYAPHVNERASNPAS